MKYLTIFDTSIRMDSEGRFCLNDLHKAAVATGANKRSKEPGEFFKTRRTKDMIDLLKKSATGNLRSTLIPVNAVETGPYEERGTFVVKELVYAYAQFVSAEFDLQVIRTYDKVARDEVDRLNGLQYRALRAELDYQQGFKEAGVCGKGLRKWRDDGPVKLKLLETFRQAMQPVLFQGY
ncbi:MAG: hypothetical protein COW02_03365 [Comamonadaceae bacterium CG12_big_fil_rev_8_21_14_0_65_59_15]|nr:MAG: hypothetical protein COW02_03365 [Comamonadaceae bacterium CG12_big_fil_rev_8_21_14_0_65_59_15]